MKLVFIYRIWQAMILIIAILVGKVGQAQTMTVSGSNWMVPLPAITEAGMDYPGTYESPTNQILVTANGPLLLGNMKVMAHYEANPNWNNNLKIAIKRNGNGSSLCLLCSITGNENYIQLTTTDVVLFTMATPLLLTTYSNINMQLKLSGVSVTIPADNYNCKVIFTISAN